MGKKEFLYKVASVHKVDGQVASGFARLHAIDECNPVPIYPRELFITLDKANPGEIVRVTAEMVNSASVDTSQRNEVGGIPRAYFLHHYDRVNQGDVLSGPYNYFEFEKRGSISWDENILKGKLSHVDKGSSIIFGGGIYFTDNKPHLMKLIADAKNFIGWGLGLDSRADLPRFLNKFTLLGTRERNLELIDNRRIFYVPCASCMNSAFDEAALEAHDAHAIEHREIVLHTNGGFNQKQIAKALDNYRLSRTVDPFDKIIANLKNSDCVITNSYHGVYWGSLLGKKVICIKTEVPKWDGIHENVAFADLDEIDKMIGTTKPVPDSYRQECRAINESFYERVRTLIGS